MILNGGCESVYPLLPRGQFTAGTLQDASSHCSLFCIIVVAWWLLVLVWLGIFWLFKVASISGKNKIPDSVASCRFEPAGHPHLWCDFSWCLWSHDLPSGPVNLGFCVNVTWSLLSVQCMSSTTRRVRKGACSQYVVVCVYRLLNHFVF